MGILTIIMGGSQLSLLTNTIVKMIQILVFSLLSRFKCNLEMLVFGWRENGRTQRKTLLERWELTPSPTHMTPGRNETWQEASAFTNIPSLLLVAWLQTTLIWMIKMHHLLSLQEFMHEAVIIIMHELWILNEYCDNTYRFKQISALLKYYRSS